ncbi:MAG: RNA 2'-phosphotransferase [Myxococcales bacterium]|nr:RNA 2'-phosphotransferase [Myxococcales bacterium]
MRARVGERARGKRLAFVLRHRPDSVGLALDPEGFLMVEALAAGLGWSSAELLEVVETDDKGRFALSVDGLRVRACQGHSVAVDLGLVACEPPAQLFHGTVARNLAAIGVEGLRPMGRTHVHLSVDEETARRVGARRGEPCVLRVDSGAMAREGFTFHRSDNGVWLTDAVPPRFLTGPPADPRG